MYESTPSSYEMMKAAADRCMKMQKERPGDYRNSQGLLVCGRCKSLRQKIMLISNPSTGDPERKTGLIVPIQCKCEIAEGKKSFQDRADAKNADRIKKLKSASLMDEKLMSASFDNFMKNPYNERGFKLCTSYAERFSQMMDKNQGLLLWGGVGTGKSYAAACIANKLMENGVPVVMTSFVKLLEIIQTTGQESAILSNLNAAKLVIFDDLGAERGTDYSLEKVYNIVDSRYRKKLPMILTTNLTIEQMKSEQDIRYSRIYDRIFEVCYPMQFTGPSWRKKEASIRFKEMEDLLGGF